MRWDVFLSYARHDQVRVAPIAAALRDRGLRVFVDEAAVSDFDSISRVIRFELAGSLALLAFYSDSYPTRRACQWELTVAYLAGQREGAPHRRVLVVNPEPGTDHIHPVELRDARHWPAPPADQLPALADKVAAHVASLTDPIGQVEALTPVRWLPAPPRLGSPAFLGRLPHLWRLHSALHSHAAPLLTGRTAPSAVLLRGRPEAGRHCWPRSTRCASPPPSRAGCSGWTWSTTPIRCPGTSGRCARSAWRSGCRRSGHSTTC